METTTFKCVRCGWIGSTPTRFCVNSGHSFWPVRYLCPECPKVGNFGRLAIYQIIPGAEYHTISDPSHLFSGSHLAYLLNCPKGLENQMINDNRLKFTEKHSKFDRNVVERYYSKKDVHAFIKAVNGVE